MKIALAQIDTTVGALQANSRLALDTWRRAAELGADLVVFPELTLTGYPPKDLLDLPDFVREAEAALEALAAQMTGGPGAIVGTIKRVRQPERPGRDLYNSAALIDDGRILSRHRKSLLPTYDVFDEDRHFQPAAERAVAMFRGRRLGITICEDMWHNALNWPRPRYAVDPVAELAAQGIDVLINISASPYSVGKRAVKAGMYADACRRFGVPLAQVNLVGGNDNLIFEGWSNVWNAQGQVIAQCAGFREELRLVDLDAPGEGSAPAVEDTPEVIAEALMLGIRDYVRKCGFQRVVVGSSGGIDSAVTLALAVGALGPENVVSVAMPSQFSTGHSVSDAAALAQSLGIEHHAIAIKPIYDAFMGELGPLFEGTPFGLAEENLQARARGALLMALSNKFGWLVLATGNKSEMAVGYCTLYGDMVGGLAVLGDVLKTQVYAIARWFNRDGERIPTGIIVKPPSAELRPDQFDTDSLPPYDVLDPIIQAYVEEHLGAEAIVARGVDAETVRRVLRMIDRAEYKRQQAALCLKVSGKAFGSGRRMPIARGE
jgi:NAD+ synthetase